MLGERGITKSLKERDTKKRGDPIKYFEKIRLTQYYLKLLEQWFMRLYKDGEPNLEVLLNIKIY